MDRISWWFKDFVKIWQNGCISLHTMCLLTSAYFVQDGFVNVVDSVLRLGMHMSTSQLYQTQELIWRLVDGIFLFGLGYMCVLGLENGSLNLIRWPTLLLFVYKVIEYFLEQLHRQLTNNILGQEIPTGSSRGQGQGQTLGPGHLEWTGHFLIPSIHIVTVTFFLWRFMLRNATYNYHYTGLASNSTPTSGLALMRRRNYKHFINGRNYSFQNFQNSGQTSEMRIPTMPKRRKSNASNALLLASECGSGSRSNSTLKMPTEASTSKELGMKMKMTTNFSRKVVKSKSESFCGGESFDNFDGFDKSVEFDRFGDDNEDFQDHVRLLDLSQDDE